jgi:TonB family protein
MPMLEENRQPETDQAPFDYSSELKQRRQMLIALALLLAALIVVLYKDWQFWFPSTATIESEPLEQAASGTAGQSQGPSKSGQTTPTARSKPKQRTPEVVAATNSESSLAPVITNRKVLPPLEVEVVAGDQHQTVTPGNPSIKLDLGSKSPATSETAASAPSPNTSSGVTNATAQVRLSPGTAEVVSHPVDPNYPMLAKQMKVQGSVVLQALIGKDGNIQDLQVLSGPAILSAAAREAVKQWRFKPYLQAGQPVETEARITVNFTISTY